MLLDQFICSLCADSLDGFKVVTAAQNAEVDKLQRAFLSNQAK